MLWNTYLSKIKETGRMALQKTSRVTSNNVINKIVIIVIRESTRLVLSQLDVCTDYLHWLHGEVWHGTQTGSQTKVEAWVYVKSYIIWFATNVHMKLHIRSTCENVHISFSAVLKYILPLSLFVSLSLTLKYCFLSCNLVQHLRLFIMKVILNIALRKYISDRNRLITSCS